MRSLFFISLFLAILGNLAPLSKTAAQVPPIAADGTLSTTITSSDGSNFTIDNGDRAGGNLFHSFSRFSVPTNGSAVFQNPTDVQNVISRVTGGSLSNIEGLIKAQGNANIFLLNPAGIVFGKGARLEVGGSFFATTADSFIFDNGFEFSASNKQVPPQLTINIPIGLRFRDNPSSITNQSVDFLVTPGNTLALVGGNVQLDGARWLTPGSRVELGGVSSAGTVGLEINGNALRLSFPDGLARADVSLTKGAEVNVRAGDGGSIAVNAQNLKMAEGSRLRAGIASGFGSVDSKAGDIDINATGAISLSGNSLIANAVLSGGVGKGGDTNIKTGSLFLTDGAQVIASSFGQGDAGKVTIQASNEVSADGFTNNGYSGAFSTVAQGAVGNSGGINVSAESLSLTRGAVLNAGIFGEGKAGNVNIDVRDGVNIAGVENIPEFNNPFSSEIVTAVFETGKGNGGDINIKARYLTLSDTARIDPMVYGEGNAGSAFIETKDFVSLSRAAIYSSVSFNGIGDGGNIKIKTGTLSLIGNETFPNDTFLSVNTFNQGNTGSVFIEADAVYISKGASIESNVYENAVGDSRDINITTGLLSLTDGAKISANSEGNGAAGNIKVFADSIELDNKSTIRAETTGKQGNISLHSGNLVLRRNSKITTNATGTATGGNITIDTINLVAFPDANSDITANAFIGSGGKITINTQGLFGMVTRSRAELEQLLNTTEPTQLDPTKLPTNDITAISQQNPTLSGTVTINTPDIDPSKGLTELPENVTDPSDRIAENPCQKGVGSEFIITGRGGLPSSPNQILSNDNILVDLVEPTTSTSSSQGANINLSITSPSAKRIVPAQGWVLNNKDEVVLVAYDPTAKNLPQRTSSRKNAVCPAPF